MRKLRDLLIAAVAGGLLLVGGAALADVPDTVPSAPDPAHTFFGCVGPSPTGSGPLRQFYALDKSHAPGLCPKGWVEVRLVPAIPPPSSTTTTTTIPLGG
jgi:hypothetical protein